MMDAVACGPTPAEVTEFLRADLEERKAIVLIIQARDEGRGCPPMRSIYDYIEKQP